MTALNKQLEDMFGNLENFTPENMEIVISETLKVFHHLQSKIESNDPKEREEAILIALELKEVLEKQAASVCEAIGMNPDELASFVQNPSNFSPEESRVIHKLSEELNQFKQEIGADINLPPLKRKKQRPPGSTDNKGYMTNKIECTAPQPISPPADLPSSADLIKLQAMMASNLQMLMNTTDGLTEMMKRSKGLKSQAGGSTETHGTMRARDPNETTGAQDETDIMALISKIDSAYQMIDGSAVYQIVADCRKQLQAYLDGKGGKSGQEKITNPDIRSMVSKAADVLNSNPNRKDHLPDIGDWTKFCTSSKIALQMGEWIGNANKEMDSSLTSPDDQMNLISIMTYLMKNPNSIQGKSIDELIFSNLGIFQTVIAKCMDDSNGNWKGDGGARQKLNDYINRLPRSPKDQSGKSIAPNYDLFVARLRASANATDCPLTISYKAILSDGFGFNDAWTFFRTGSPIYDPNHILYGK